MKMPDTLPLDATATVDIRDAACVVVIDATDVRPRLLMGRRHSDQIFLPNKWVFPGGRVDPSDLIGDKPNTEHGGMAQSLTPFMHAARRELLEETGLRLAAASDLLPVARAITPPGRIRRYDTWFFLARVGDVLPERGEGDGELLDLDWFTFDQARRLDIPNITKLVLEDATAWHESGGAPLPRVPFYFEEAGIYRRTMIDPAALMETPKGLART